MFEKFIEGVGRSISTILRKPGDFIENARVESNILKEQVSATSIKVKSTMKVSISEHTLVNYFRNRVVGEFLRLVANLTPYKYESYTGKYVAYFVRYRAYGSTEYIKFVRTEENAKYTDIYYTIVNKYINAKGITSNIGSTADTVLKIDAPISTCIYSAVNSTKAPLFLAYVLDDYMSVGNPKFIYDCWITACKVINSTVMGVVSEQRFNAPDDGTPYSNPIVEKLKRLAGIHMFMSYFCSLDSNYYKYYYQPTKMNTLIKAIEDYNSRHFNVNKIIGFSYDKDNKEPSLVVNENKTSTVLTVYGVSLTLTGVITSTPKTAIEKFNILLADFLLKHEDASVKYNFLFYMFSTQVKTDMEEEALTGEEEPSSVEDAEMGALNNKLEPYIAEAMDNNGFTLNQNKEYTSKTFEEDIDKAMNSYVKDPVTSYPEAVEPVIPIKEIKTEPAVPQTPAVSRGDAITALRDEAGSNDTLVRPEIHETEVDLPVTQTIRDISSILNTPIGRWTTDDCLTVLGSEDKLNSSITRQDVLDRMMFLSSQSK